MRVMYKYIAIVQSEIVTIFPACIHLNAVSAEASSMKSPINRLISVGFQYWIQSIRATYTPEILTLPEIRPHASRAWLQLDSADLFSYGAMLEGVRKSLGSHSLVR